MGSISAPLFSLGPFRQPLGGCSYTGSWARTQLRNEPWHAREGVWLQGDSGPWWLHHDSIHWVSHSICLGKESLSFQLRTYSPVIFQLSSALRMTCAFQKPPKTQQDVKPTLPLNSFSRLLKTEKVRRAQIVIICKHYSTCLPCGIMAQI